LDLFRNADDFQGKLDALKRLIKDSDKAQSDALAVIEKSKVANAESADVLARIESDANALAVREANLVKMEQAYAAGKQAWTVESQKREADIAAREASVLAREKSVTGLQAQAQAMMAAAKDANAKAEATQLELDTKLDAMRKAVA